MTPTEARVTVLMLSDSVHHDNHRPPLPAYVRELAEAADVLAARSERLEALADAVRNGLCGLPDHPWIPGVSAHPVRDALLALDGVLRDDMDRDIPIG